ncbi:MAG: TatD family hydrolase [Opitutales bacterium]
MWIDTHCHLESFSKSGEFPAVLERAQAAGVARCITIGTSPQDWPIYRAMSADHPGRIDWTVGLHPSDVDENWETAVAEIPGYFSQVPKPVGLGEIGLDYFRLPKDAEARTRLVTAQKAAFAAQLQLAKARDCPVVVHSRAAFEDCVAWIDASGVDWARVVFHCFTEDAATLQTLLERGGRASFTGIATYAKAASVREAVKLQGLERLMIETDAPYLAPEPKRGKTNEPAFLVHTGERLAKVLEVPPETLAERTTANALAFFGLKT